LVGALHCTISSFFLEAFLFLEQIMQEISDILRKVREGL